MVALPEQYAQPETATPTPEIRRIILGGAMTERDDNSPLLSMAVAYWKLISLGIVRSHNESMYDRMVESLGPKTKVVVLPEYGLKAPWTITDQVAQEMELSEENPAHVVAHSYGGVIAPHLATKLPGSIESIVSLDPPGRARVNILPWNLPWVSPFLKATNNYHISRGRHAYSEDPNLPPMLTIGSQESGTIIAEDALLLDWGTDMRRVLFGRPGSFEGVSDAIIEGKRVELRESAEDLEHAALAWNPDVIKLIQEFHADVQNIGKIGLANSAEVSPV